MAQNKCTAKAMTRSIWTVANEAVGCVPDKARRRILTTSAEITTRAPAAHNSGSQETNVARLRSQPETDLSVGFPHQSRVLDIDQAQSTFNIRLAQPNAAGSGLGNAKAGKSSAKPDFTFKRSDKKLTSLWIPKMGWKCESDLDQTVLGFISIAHSSLQLEGSEGPQITQASQVSQLVSK